MVRDPNDRGRVLRGMWPHIVWVGLIEFKSVSRPFRRGDLWRLFAYGFAWLAAHTGGDALRVGPDERRAACVDDVTLFLVVPRRNPSLDAELAEMGQTLSPLAAGYAAVRGAPLRTVLIELGAAGEAEHDELMQWFAGLRARCSLATRRWIGQHTAGQGSMNATPALEGWEDWLAQYLRSLSTEERVAGLAPEERLAGLSREELILALPYDLLRAQPESVIASLSPDAQARVRARLGG